MTNKVIELGEYLKEKKKQKEAVEACLDFAAEAAFAAKMTMSDFIHMAVEAFQAQARAMLRERLRRRDR